MQKLIDFLPILTGILAAIGALFAYYRRAHRQYLKPYFGRRKSLRLLLDNSDALLNLAGKKEQIDDMLEATAAVRRIEAMLTPNGGSSLFDAVNRIERQMAINQTAQRLVLLEDTAIIFWTDADGRNVRVSKAYAELVGRSPEEMLGEGWKSHVAAHCRRAVAEEWNSAVRDRREYYQRLDMENRTTHKIITADVAALPAKVQGQVVGYVGRITLVDRATQDNHS